MARPNPHVGRQMKPVVALLAVALSGPAFAAKPYSMQSLVLLQPDFVLSERVQVDDLSHYVKAINAAAETNLAAVVEPIPAAGFIVVAVRPGGQSKVWLDFSPELPSAVAAQLRLSVEKLAPFQGKGGVVVFAINATLWGAAPTERKLPSPSEWQEVMKAARGPMEIGELVELAWSSKAGA